MEEYTCRRTCRGTCIAEVLISIAVGIIAGIVFTNGLLTTVVTFANVALVAAAVISIIFTLLILGAKAFGKCSEFDRFMCKTGGCLLAAIIGTIVAGIALLIIEISTGSIASILSVGFSAFFFVWMVLSIVSLIGCLIRDICNR